MKHRFINWQQAIILTGILTGVLTSCLAPSQSTGMSPIPDSTAPSTSSVQPSETASPTTAASTTPSTKPSVAATSSPEGQLLAQSNCADPQTQAEINDCSEKSADTADQQLNKAYQELREKITDSKEEEALIDAQRAWIQFRDKNCAFSSSRFEGGSIAPTVYSSCVERITKQRTEELKGYLQGMDGGGIF